jgi:AraC-like DNA-binding protein
MSSLSGQSLAPALRPFVAGLHYVEADGATRLERILPGGRAHIMVNLHEDEFRTYHGAGHADVRRVGGAILEGPASEARVIDTRLMRCLVSVDFTLGGASAFCTTPLSEARDELVELHQVWGTDGALLRERLLDAPSVADKLRVVERVLLQHLVRREAPDRAISFAAALMEAGATVAEVSSRTGLLPKTLVRRFLSHVGLTPKRFSRIRRLQRLVASIGEVGDVDWCDVAAVHGYVDQAHLIHDFRELTGLTPTAYRPRSTTEPNHVAVDQ